MARTGSWAQGWSASPCIRRPEYTSLPFLSMGAHTEFQSYTWRPPPLVRGWCRHRLLSFHWLTSDKQLGPCVPWVFRGGEIQAGLCSEAWLERQARTPFSALEWKVLSELLLNKGRFIRSQPLVNIQTNQVPCLYRVTSKPVGKVSNIDKISWRRGHQVDIALYSLGKSPGCSVTLKEPVEIPPT